MGTHTEFTGAIRIVPCVEESLAKRLNEFFDLRHMKRDVKVLESLYQDDESRRAHTLLGDGDFGSEGAYYMPDETKEFPLLTYTEPFCAKEGLLDQMQMNKPPEGCPSLYCDLVLVPATDSSCSYLGWTEADKTYELPEWLHFIASLLVPLGYHLDGQMFAVVECGMDFYYVKVSDENVEIENFSITTTYDREFYESCDNYHEEVKNDNE